MRYEAKHSHFKHLARVIANFKNMAKTLAMRHQMYMCYHLSNPVGYLRFPNSYSSGKPLCGNHFDKQNFNCMFLYQ